MVVNIQYQKMSTSESLNKLLLKKLDRLGNKYQWVIKANVLFKEENDRTGEGKVCEIELSAPGPRLFAKANTDNFEKSMAETINDLKRQLEKRQGVFVKH
ncbi:HPF/RaiA family ribosome-associated protein [Flagellimonas meridianipacifica]|uniref:Putative sigma-54 modulation protein n=1 Tax=Flagellimonas meridianipacifica TaxID=1080225 RepID=A0A2T0MJF7_9FLAO|nr:HPF/RaiA family ribosome-associated protein [Allomuricauda pacifica]PRX57636.1 putative sigma-54 modulation protein [Allomuricauda pacifica]